jgi:ectoine hydroxylase-related dioxygenase (phytanoyl-CoA dioxygenase family)
LGTTAVPYRATLFEKTEQANWLVAWHQDTALPIASRFDDSPDSRTSGWGPWSIKETITYAHAPTWALSRVVALRLHLDDSSSENGPLRVIPDSHSLGVVTDQVAIEHAVSHPSVECLVRRGGVLAMSPLAIHSSSKSRSTAPRRVLHIEYADSLDLAPGIRLALA